MSTSKMNGRAYVQKLIREGNMNPALYALDHRLFQFAHIAEDIAAGATYYYSFVAPADKEIILFDRTLLMSGGSGLVQTLTSPDTVTHGDVITPMNAWLDKPAPETAFYSDSSNVTGGWVAVPELLESGNARQSGYGERGGDSDYPQGYGWCCPGR